MKLDKPMLLFNEAGSLGQNAKEKEMACNADGNGQEPLKASIYWALTSGTARCNGTHLPSNLLDGKKSPRYVGPGIYGARSLMDQDMAGDLET
jgi:hypothetical protein